MSHGPSSVRRFTSVRAGLGLLTGGERRIQLIAALALLAGASYLTWRVAFTLDGAPRWLALPLLAAEIWGFLQLLSLAVQAWSVPTIARPASTRAHDAAVLVLGANASESALERTLIAAGEIIGAPPVVVSDPVHRTDVAELATRHGARYAVVEDTLRAGLEATGGELVLVLQGGQVPLADVFDATVGYFEADDVAVVQCRTGLANPSAFTYMVNGRSEEDLFNEVIGPSLGASGNAPWGGSASVVRRSALGSVDVVEPMNGASQAVRSTIRLRAAGHKVRFHPEPLVQAVRPDTLDAYLNRGHRRAFANLRVFATRENPLVAAGLPLRSRFLYLGALSRYFSGIHRFVLLAVLSGTLASGQLPIEAPFAEIAAIWLPAHVLGGLAGLALGRGTLSLGDRTRHGLRSMEAYSSAALRALTPLLPTRPRRRADIDERGLRALGRLALLTGFTLLLDALLIVRGVGEWTGDILPAFEGRQVYPVLILAVLVLAPMMDVLQLIASRRGATREFRHGVNLPARIAVGDATVVDLTPRGLGLELPAEAASTLERGSTLPVEVELPLVDGETETARVCGVLRHVARVGPTATLGVEITDVDAGRPDALSIYYWVTRPTRLARGLDRDIPAVGVGPSAPRSSEAVGSRGARRTVRLATSFATVMVVAAFPAAAYGADEAQPATASLAPEVPDLDPAPAPAAPETPPPSPPPAEPAEPSPAEPSAAAEAPSAAAPTEPAPAEEPAAAPQPPADQPLSPAVELTPAPAPAAPAPAPAAPEVEPVEQPSARPPAPSDPPSPPQEPLPEAPAATEGDNPAASPDAEEEEDAIAETATVSASVRTSDGTPVAGVSVVAISRGTTTPLGTTSEAGTLSAELPPGRYRFRATHRGRRSDLVKTVVEESSLAFGLASLRVTVLGSSGGPLAGNRVQIVEPGRGWQDVGVTGEDGAVSTELFPGSHTVRAQHGGRWLTQRVALSAAGATAEFRLAQTRVRVLDQDGAGVSGTPIQVHLGSRGWTGIGETDSSGSVLYDVLPGRIVVRAQIQGSWRTLRSRVGALGGEVEFRLAPVTARVLDPDGNPVVGDAVEMHLAGTGWTPIGSTDASGEVTTQAPAGRLVMRARHDGRWQTLRTTATDAGATVVFQLVRTTLRVLDADGVGLTEPSIELHVPRKGWTSLVPDASGVATVQTFPGRLVARAKHGGTTRTRRAPISASGGTLDFQLVRATLRVLDAAGGPIPGDELEVVVSGKGWTPIGVTDSDGVLVTQRLPGRLTARAKHNGRALTKRATITEAGGAVDFQLVPVTFRLFDADGGSLVGAPVETVVSGKGWTAVGTSDSSGQVTTEIFPGRLSARAKHDGRALVRRVTISASGGTIDFNLSRATFRVLDTAGVGVAGSTIEAALPGRGWTSLGTTGPNGEISAQAFPGRLTVRAIHNGSTLLRRVTLSADAAVFDFSLVPVSLRLLSSDGAALSDAAIDIHIRGLGWTPVTGAESGELTVERLPGVVVARVTHEGRVARTRVRVGAEGGTIEFRLGRATVKLIDRDGAVLAGERVELSVRGKGWVDVGQTDTAGLVHLNLLPGTVRVRGHHETRTRSASARLEPGTPLEIVLEIRQNRRPVASDDFVEGDADSTLSINVTANDTDPDGDTLEVTAVEPPASGGEVELSESGTITYVPPEGFSGEAQIGYTVSDGAGGDSRATATFSILGLASPESSAAEPPRSGEEPPPAAIPTDSAVPGQSAGEPGEAEESESAAESGESAAAAETAPDPVPQTQPSPSPSASQPAAAEPAPAADPEPSDPPAPAPAEAVGGVRGAAASEADRHTSPTVSSPQPDPPSGSRIEPDVIEPPSATSGPSESDSQAGPEAAPALAAVPDSGGDGGVGTVAPIVGVAIATLAGGLFLLVRSRRRYERG